jgi:hypothetical protein
LTLISANPKNEPKFGCIGPKVARRERPRCRCRKCTRAMSLGAGRGAESAGAAKSAAASTVTAPAIRSRPILLDLGPPPAYERRPPVTTTTTPTAARTTLVTVNECGCEYPLADVMTGQAWPPAHAMAPRDRTPAPTMTTGRRLRRAMSSMPKAASTMTASSHDASE